MHVDENYLVIIMDPKTRKVLKKWVFNIPSVSKHTTIDYKCIEGRDILTIGNYSGMKFGQKDEISAFMDLRTGYIRTDKPLNILSFQKFKQFKFCFDRLNQSSEFNKLGH